MAELRIFRKEGGIESSLMLVVGRCDEKWILSSR